MGKRAAVARLFSASMSRLLSCAARCARKEDIMARVSAEKRAELEGFWRAHHEGWQASDLNQREYCELHGLPLSRFGNWRDQFKAQDEVRQSGLLYRRGGLRHMSSHMSNRENGLVSTGYTPISLMCSSAWSTAIPPTGSMSCCPGTGRQKHQSSNSDVQWPYAPMFVFKGFLQGRGWPRDSARYSDAREVGSGAKTSVEQAQMRGLATAVPFSVRGWPCLTSGIDQSTGHIAFAGHSPFRCSTSGLASDNVACLMCRPVPPAQLPK